MLWLIALVTTGIGGLWLAARHWYGWVVYTINEVLWFAYGITLGAPPLYIMAVLWGAIGIRNTAITYRKAHQ